MPLSQVDIIRFIQSYTNKPIDMTGFCYGFSAQHINATILGAEADFFRRLDILHLYRRTPQRLFNKIKQIHTHLSIRPDSPLTTEQADLLEIPAFLEALMLQQTPEDFFAIHRTATHQDFSLMLPFTAAKGQTKIPHKLQSSFIHPTETELPIWLNELAKALTESKQPLIFMLRTLSHAMTLKYDASSEKFELTDVEYLDQRMLNHCSQKLSADDLAKMLIDCYGLPTKQIPLHIETYCSAPDTPIPAILRQPLAESIIAKPPIAERFDGDNGDCLILACAHAQPEAAIGMIKGGLNVNRQTLYHKVTPLYIAARESLNDVVTALLEAGANPNSVTRDGNTPLYMASVTGNVSCMRSLLTAGANPNAFKSNGMSPLFVAIKYGHIDAVRLLLENGATTASPHLGNAMDFALLHQQEAIATILIGSKKTKAPPSATLLSALSAVSTDITAVEKESAHETRPTKRRLHC